MATAPTTPRTLRRRPAAATATPSTQTPSREKMRLNGLWRENHWWCNCEPRRQAVQRKVQKRGANRGRNFWACPAVEGCRFFLWSDDAELREMWTRPSHDDDEAAQQQQQQPKTPTLTQQRLTSYGIQALPTPAASTGKKRKRDALRDAHDYLGDVGSDDERALADLTDRSVEKLVGTTPCFDDDDDPYHVGTPARPVARTLFPPRSNGNGNGNARDGCGSGSSKKRKTVSFDSSSSLKTPTPVLGDSSPADQDTTAQEIMALLRVGRRIDQALLASVGQVLAASANRTRGLVASRDAMRATLVDKTAEVATLRAQCAQLEDGRVELNSRITNMKATLMKVYEDN